VGALLRTNGVSRGVAAAVGIGLLVRLLFTFGYWVDKPLTHDEQEYLHLAQNVAAGRGLTYDASAAAPDVERFGRAPLYPLLLALIARVAPTAHLLAAIRVAQSILGAVAIALLAFVARRAAGPSAGTLAAWIAALYPPLVWMPAYVLSESLYVPLAFGNVLLVGRLIDGGERFRTSAPSWQLLMSGVLGGLAALTRPVHVFYLITVGAWLLLKRQLRWAMLVGIGALIVIAPWTARNYHEYGRLVLIASEGGITFWTGNHPLSPGEGDMAANPAIKHDNQRLRAEHPGLSAEELEPIYYREAIGRIASQPRWWLGLELRKLFYLIVPTGPSYTLHSARYLAATLVSYGLLLPFGCAGLVMLARRGRWPRSLGLLLLSAIVACLIFFPQERFRVPTIDPVLIVGAAAVLVRRQPFVVNPSAAPFALSSSKGEPGAQDRPVEPRTHNMTSFRSSFDTHRTNGAF
jgi:Dolichyl-phosphate-mannose-protein mannosyltransferase